MKTSHLNGLRALEAALRTGNFRSAADELGVPPAAVGQQVRGLEDYLGRKLFVRSPTGVKPTDYASSVADKLTSSFVVISDVLAQLKDQQASNRLALTMTQSFAEKWLTWRLAKSYALDVLVDLRIDTTNRLVDLFAGEFDLAIRYSPPAPESHEDKPLFEEYVLPVCSPEFAASYDLSGKLSSLENVPLFHLHELTTDPDWVDWEGWGRKFGFEEAGLRRGLRFSRLSFGLQAAISGHGLVLCGITEAYNAIVDGLLVMPFGAELISKTSYQYRLLAVRGRHKSSVQKQFEAWIIGEAEIFRTSMKNLLFGI